MTSLSLTGRAWTIGATKETGEAIADSLLRVRQLDPLGEGELLYEFGHDARRFRDFDKAAERIMRAIAAREKIGIFGDYDCDGITSTAILARFLLRRGIQPVMRLPHRLNEGYGLRQAIVEEFRNAGVTLLLTVDTGATAIEPITLALSEGIDVIVLDHHHLMQALPPAFAILHPSLASPPIVPAPCGAGVAWSVVNSIQRESGDAKWDDRETDMALAAIGTIADIVELRGGNRTLAHSGLLALSRLKNGPLALLCMNSGLRPPYSSRDIAFRIAPRINAAGRMADPHIALGALLGDMEAMLSLDALNRERQEVVSAHLELLLPRAEMDDGSVLCFVHEDYSPGVCGLLAGRLCESFGKPVLVGALRDGVCVASLRSIQAFDVTAGLARAADLLITFGGHAMAAGCTFRHAAFDALRERLEADIRACVPPKSLVPRIFADAAIIPDEVTLGLCDSLRALEPFGHGNPEPRFFISNVRLERARRVGSGGKHLQASVRGRKLIGFNLGHLEEFSGKPIDLLCRIGTDNWRGSRAPQLLLDDMRVSAGVTREPACLPL
ncbi:DHH family phosphoesterase [Candidatus Peregrinibacteria bacterium]|nr:DHH family phosphoesterase [Candidatus Peregrinibacteria bacterium]